MGALLWIHIRDRSIRSVCAHDPDITGHHIPVCEVSPFVVDMASRSEPHQTRGVILWEPGKHWLMPENIAKHLCEAANTLRPPSVIQVASTKGHCVWESQTAFWAVFPAYAPVSVYPAQNGLYRPAAFWSAESLSFHFSVTWCYVTWGLWTDPMDGCTMWIHL